MPASILLLVFAFLRASVTACIPTATTEVPKATTPSCPSGWTNYTNSLGSTNCFILLKGVTDDTGFADGCAEAKTTCELLGGELASIHDADENEFIYNLGEPGGTSTLTPPPGYNQQHISNTCIGLEPQNGVGSRDPDSWKWNDASVYNYQNWATDVNAPNDGGASGNSEGCAAILDSAVVPCDTCTAKWDDFPCNLPMRNAVCETAAVIA